MASFIIILPSLEPVALLPKSMPAERSRPLPTCYLLLRWFLGPFLLILCCLGPIFLLLPFDLLFSLLEILLRSLFNISPPTALAADTSRGLAGDPRVGKNPTFCFFLPPKCQIPHVI